MSPHYYRAGVMIENIHLPSDLKKLSVEELEQLAGEIRTMMIQVVSKNGGHLASNLGVVELTLALHYVFNTPADKIIWDVSHQCYPHKIVTGRRDRFPTLRQYEGISGFCKREESEYDAFNAGHASTSISAALGMAAGRDMLVCSTPARIRLCSSLVSRAGATPNSSTRRRRQTS